MTKQQLKNYCLAVINNNRSLLNGNTEYAKHYEQTLRAEIYAYTDIINMLDDEEYFEKQYQIFFKHQ